MAIQGLETLGARLDKHIKNAEKVAKFLNAHPKIRKVNYAGLVNFPYNLLANKYFPKGVAGLLTIELNEGFEAGKNLVEQTKLFTHCANIGDARSLIIHPASTTHSQLTEQERIQSGVSDGLIRLSIGLEDANDLIEDLKQALDYSEVQYDDQCKKVI
ncbi:PLP-dependent transferase [Francisella noatunensis]|uniref:PLP-dependent transferase n=1 Tax=Francisella noatunensis TaxID=657445 RepID=UPI001F188FDC|nr:PLP-dependent transferase [Francisella noatunensis]